MDFANYWFSSGAGGAGYEIEQSLRFNWTGDSTRLYRTFSTDNSNANFTVSFWCKRAQLTAYNAFLAAQVNASNYEHWMWYNDDKIGTSNGVSGTATNHKSTALFRDPSAWYHVVWKNVASGATTVYVNNTQVLSFTRGTKAVNGNYNHNIGVGSDSGSFGANFYLAEYHLVDGSALNPTDFGEPDDNGVWRPKRYTGSYGTNGFYLKFDPTATNGIGHDHSGNGNNFTATGFVVSGTGTDVMSDTPTTNWATLNPLDNGGNTVSDGNLVVNTSAGFDLIRSTFFLSSRKWYWEVTADDGGEGFVGISSAAESLSSRGAETANSATIRTTNGNIRTSGSDSSYGSAVSDGDVMMFALDMDAGKFWAGKGGTWFNSGDPAAGTNAGKTGLTEPVSPSISLYDNEDYTVNFGQRAFAYTPPTGFKALNTSNLPAPDIADGSDYFNTVLWSGNGATDRDITGVGFAPDLVWAKDRSGALSHVLQDRVRGAGNTILQSNNASHQSAQGLANGYIDNFTTDGFETTSSTANQNYYFNSGSDTYVAWNWLAGGSGSSGSAGSLTSTISSNPSAGFSIVTYEGVPTTGTVGHGLGVVPAMIIVKSYLDSENWYVWHQSFSNLAQDYLLLNATDAKATVSNLWNNTAPTDTVFSVGSDSATCGDGYEYVAYCFAEVEGYSKFGSYTGNGSSDGPFIYTGFAPAMVILKSSSNANSWRIMDRARDSYNLAEKVLIPDSNATENTNSFFIDFLSNGFKVRDGGGQNISGWTNLWAAFAENPFGGEGVSPATAR